MELRRPTWGRRSSRTRLAEADRRSRQAVTGAGKVASGSEAIERCWNTAATPVLEPAELETAGAFDRTAADG